MLIEHAERFGLSQLHQLRGRIGRGAEQSWCILMSDRKFFYAGGRRALESGEERVAAKRRLDTMVRTTDGFEIAEEDLALRGPGDFLGTRQHGFPDFKIADIVTDLDILAEARADAFAAIERDPHLRDPEYATVKQMLIARLDASSSASGLA
jgi:ATP-dependent DNA helicase RecG